MKQFFENLKLSSKQYKFFGIVITALGIISILIALMLLIVSVFLGAIVFGAIGVALIYSGWCFNKLSKLQTASANSSGKKSIKIGLLLVGVMFVQFILLGVFALTDDSLQTQNPTESETTTQESVGEEIDFDEATKSTTAPQTTIPQTTTPPTTVPPTVAPTQPITQQVIDPVEEYVAPEESEVTVYRTATGTKYHRTSSCGNGTYWSITLSEALAQDLEPCQRCY